MIDRVLSPICMSTNSFNLAGFFAALVSAAMKSSTSVIARTGEGTIFKADSLSPEQLIGADHPLTLPNREQLSLQYSFFRNAL
jgi:hypothetical protein